MRGNSPLIHARRSGRSTLLGQATYASAEPPVPNQNVISPLAVPMVRGPYQNNGASPWYANAALGTPGQPLKMAIDTGAAFVWVTSSLCAPGSCQHSSGGQFVYQQSSSFQWVDQDPKPVSFGPWGTMTVESGQDLVALPSSAPLALDMYLSSNYSGSQFARSEERRVGKECWYRCRSRWSPYH